jgi:hypothetical protein
MRIIHTDELKLVPWANRAGYARDIAMAPPDSPGWQVSLAEISVSGPFSNFPGVDRSFMVIGGQVTLEVDGEINEVAEYQVFEFDGGSDTHVIADVGPVRALNVMTERGSWSHSMSIVELANGPVMRLNESEYVMLLEGEAVARSESQSVNCRSDVVVLKRFDVVVGGTGVAEINGSAMLAYWRICPKT